ncbi:MAG: protein TolQ [Pseudomonadota bacterium]|jgi:biopolymer transport protein TolQ
MTPTLVTDAASLSPLALFLQADIVVKLVMLGLLVASIWTWSIIVSHAMTMRRTQRDCDQFEKDFWRTEETHAFFQVHRESSLPVARVFQAGMIEWQRSTANRAFDREGTRQRLASTMGTAIAAEVDRLGDRLNILATVGSVAPFVGLFGTVWGIMRSFTAIASQQNTSLSVVAPGIAEALFATAIGLFAAIPAVIAYNRFGHGLNRLEARLTRFADGFHALLSRKLES